ncbi:MAG: hypothetical protein HN742_11430 [Lentisphaerae bacterium]|jgi:hypothetical protein|nr:hypothetical protein [Lentisphaerota bacterium]MBT4817861.1 hypothetical protein [Lentisphaerota bacterium]MBT5613195.1 hypothetical protein [Lentisphaerota bacterium]MBT7059991.1 hypothetical protein [Lentisphaerota bacterium]MBT7842478.1 hypothetical protein [Lentisphaerota bacterium]
MLRVMRETIQRLMRDDSGVVLIFTVVVFLTLFLIMCSVVAVAQNIRYRIGLQNAADAAAYSAAVVQADTLSRIAAINRAMGWAYVHHNKRTREYIIDKWLRKAYSQWQSDRSRAYQKAHGYRACRSYRWYAGARSQWGEESLRINGHTVPAGTLKSTLDAVRRESKSHDKLGPEIDALRKLIEDMNVKEADLVSRLPDRVRAVVQHTVTGNLDSGDLYFVSQTEVPDQYCRILDTKADEEAFLRYAGIKESAYEEFGKGTDDWYALGGTNGLQRIYKQTGKLVASWSYRGEYWKWVRRGKYWSCEYRSKVSGSRTVRGSDARDSRFSAAVAQPRVLKKTFFGKEASENVFGAISVGVAREMGNPFQALVGDSGSEGVFGMFSLPESRHMWAVASARAGYSLTRKAYAQEGNPVVDDDQGRYASVWNHPGNGQDWSWTNLACSDWDAVLLPVLRALSNSSNGTWEGSGTAHQVLGAMQASSNWRRVGDDGIGTAYLQASGETEGGLWLDCSSTAINSKILH